MAFKRYIYEIKRARGESMTSWISRSDEALRDMRKETGNSAFVEFVLRKLFLVSSPMMSSSQLIGSHGKDSGKSSKAARFFSQLKRLDDDFRENNDPYIDEDGNFLAKRANCV